MKIKILLGSLLFTNLMIAQVGVGTSDPKVSLHIAGKPTVTTEKDGVLIPKITGDQLKAKSYTTTEIGTMIYITDIPTGTNTSNTVQLVDAPGFYYLASVSGNLRWTKMIAATFDKTDDEWVNSGTSVILGKKADGTTSRTGHEQVAVTDGGRLGLGTSSPDSGIHLVSNNDGSKDDIKIESYNSSPGANFLFFSGGYANNAPADIGTNSTIGQINFHGRVSGGFGTSHSRIFSTYKGAEGADITLSAGGASKSTLYASVNQRVGIATNGPRTTLDVNGTYAIQEQSVAVANNAASFTPTSSQVVLTGAATTNITVTPTAGVAGQRMVIVNTSTGGQKAILGTYEIQNDQAVDFVYSGTKWRALSNGELSNTKRLYTGKAQIPPHTVATSTIIAGDYNTTDWKVVDAGVATGAKYELNSLTQGGIKASNRVYVYEYQGIAFTNLEKLHPMLTAGNDSNYPDTFSANFVKLANVNGKTRLTVTITRNDLVSNINSLIDSSIKVSNWQGTFFLNITLLETN